MDSSDSMQQSAFPEEEKLTEVIDEDASWFDKNLGEESDNTEELNTQMNQDDLDVDLDIKDSDLGEDKVGEKSGGDVEPDSRSELLDDVSDNPSKNSNEPALDTKKDDLAELKDISIDNKKHDISNELKEMFEEKSSDAEEMNESAMDKHELDGEIAKEDKLKDIVPDDILGKDDSFDELDNDALHQELTAHLTYNKDKELTSDLPDANVDLTDGPTSQDHENEQDDSQSQPKTDTEIDKSLDDLSFESKTELLKDLAENMDVKEIDDIMEQDVPSEESCSQKDMSSELKDISSGLDDSCVNELKDDLENQLQNITGETLEDLQTEQEHGSGSEIMNHVDKASIELNQANMMVEFAHDNSNQVLIQINTDHSETPPEQPQNSDSLIMETSDGQTLVFSTETLNPDNSSDNDVVSQVEGGAEFLEAVTGKLEDVLVPTIKEEPKVETVPAKPVSPVIEPPPPTVPEKEPVKEEPPKCCISTCKSGKTSLKTTYRYFKPPVNKLLYKKWEYIFNQAKQQISPSSLICELHFRTGLIYKRGVNRNGNVIWALREGALPKLSPSGLLRMTGGTMPQPSTTVQVPKRPEGIVKPPSKPDPPPAEPKTVPNVPATVPSTAPKVVSGKKILQKPVKTVATKVSSEVTDIGFLYKNPELLKAAQEDLITQDILVCGECHSVFHIMELFQAHKMANNCEGQSNFKGNPSEPKPPVWAFLLWKSAQAKLCDVESSWRLYQRWCKMDERIRDSWIAAGKFLQEGHSLAALKIIETPMPKPNKVGRPPLREKFSDDDDEYPVRKAKRPRAQAGPRNESPQVPETEMDMGGAGDAAPYVEHEEMEVDTTHELPAEPLVEADEVEQTLQDLSRHTPELLTTDVEIKQEILSDDESGENKENDNDPKKIKSSDDIQNCSRCKKPVTNLKGGIICAAGCYGYFHVECTRVATLQKLIKMGTKKLTWKCDTCKLTHTSRPAQTPKQPVPQRAKDPEKEEEEFVVEKIVSRRYNIKKKHYEYLLKWEGYPSEQNTWEPAENLGTCQHLLKAFEEALAKQQAAKLAANKGMPLPVKQETPYKVKPPIIPKKKDTPGPSTPVTNILSGRPVRSSKKKAMDQVKVWCGSIVRPTEDDNVGLKRKASSDSEYEEEVVVKKVKIEGKVKFEQESEDSESGNERFTSRGRGKVLGSASATKPVQPQTPLRSNPVVNGEPKESNLAAALGLESDDEEVDHIPAAVSETLQKSPPGLQKMSSLSPQSQKVLVASAKGVVKVDPKQVPNLSSGVYIMSNKSGIVKVDNNKTLNSLQKSGIIKKPIGGALPKPVSPNVSPSVKPNSGVVILPKSDSKTPQQKVGVVRRGPIPTTPTSTTPASTTPASTAPASTVPASSAPASASTTPSSQTPARPAGVLKPKTGILPRPLGMLKPTMPGSTPSASPATPITRPLGIPAGLNSKMQQVRPRVTTPIRGRPITTPMIRKPLTDGPNLQASTQQKLLIAKKKAAAESLKPSVTISPVKKAPIGSLTPRVEASPGGMLPIRSTNKALSHPMLSRGRGRGYRGRGRGNSLAQLVQREIPEPVKESKLVESDNLLMEFQEQSESGESDDGVEDIFNIAELPPIQPDSPPRHLTLCPLTGKRLAKAEGEKTPEPTPPPSPKAPTPPPPPPEVKVEELKEPTHILPDHEDEVMTPVPVQAPPSPVAITTAPSRVPHTPVSTTTTTIVKQDGMICKVEMSPGGTTGTLIEAISADAAPAGVTEGTVTIKKPLASRNRINRGPQLSVMPTNSTSTSLGTITVPAKKLFQEENEDDDMVTITGEDGLVYQVSNSELTGNTLLVSSGEDGQQQCVYVTTDGDGTEDGSTILTLDTAYADAVAQLGSDQVNILSTENGDQFYIKEGDDEGQMLTMDGEEGMIAGDDQSGQVVAQLVEAGEPAPGGSRRVVLLLPDGNLMMTEVDEEQYAALDLDK